MPANTNPIFILTPNMGFGRLDYANTTRDGSGTVTSVFTGGTNGSRVDRITLTASSTGATASSVAKVGRIFISDTGGTVWRIYREVALAAASASSTVIGATSTINIVGGLFLSSGQKIGATISIHTGNTEQIDVIVEGGDF